MRAPKDMTADELADAAGENFAAHAAWCQRRVAGMRAWVDERLVVADSGLPCDTFNLVCRARLSGELARGAADEVIAHFRSAGRPFAWWLAPGDEPAGLGEVLAAAGLEPAESELAMAADLAALPERNELPPGLTVDRATTPADVRAFAEVLAANWDPPDADVLRFYDAAAPVLLRGDAPLWLYVGRLDGQAVAAAQLTAAGGVAGLYNVATRAAFRRRGIGTAMTHRPLLDARSAGYRTAVLQAAPDGVGVYRRLGFAEFGRITEYKPSC